MNMRKQRRWARIPMAFLTILALTLLLMGCGDSGKDASADNDTSKAVTEEAAAAETEAAEQNEAAGGTETEAGSEIIEETEENVIATGYIAGPLGEVDILDSPDVVESGVVCRVNNDEMVEIIGEFYNQYDEVDFWRIRLASGEEGYLRKQYIQLSE